MNDTIVPFSTAERNAQARGEATTFTFDGHAVRCVSRNGEPWFIAVDVCAALGIRNTADATSRLDDDEKGIGSTDTLGGKQQVVIVSESGLYTLILRCRDATTPGSLPHRFRRWATSEVIPAIRKTGSYNPVAAFDPIKVLNDPDALRGLLLGYTERVIELEGERAVLLPKAEAHDRLAEAEGSLNITEAAKALQRPPQQVFTWMATNGWIYRRTGSKNYLGYQSRVGGGHLIHKVSTIRMLDGTDQIREQVRVTPKGLTLLAKSVPGAQAPLPLDRDAMA